MSNSLPTIRKGQPWYRNAAYYRAKANLYLQKHRLAGQEDGNDGLWAEIESLSAFNRSRLVFESNLIEGAGLASAGETQRLIGEYFPKLPGDPKEFASLLEGRDVHDLISRDNLRRIRNSLHTARGDSTPKTIIPSVSFAGRPRAYREVLQHYQAVDLSQSMTLRWFLHTAIVRGAREIRRLAPNEAPKVLAPTYKAVGVKALRDRKLLSNTAVKRLHRVLATRLMPDDSGVGAGEYRIDNRTVGWDISFPAPENVAQCMEVFSSEANSMIVNCITNPEVDVFDVAAEVSYRFVRIHPFPDFNGRLSRILMNMVLLMRGCFFQIALRGDGKGRHRYFTALRHANGGRIETLGTLIAMSVVETYEEADRNLSLAGLTPLIEMEEDNRAANDEHPS